MAPGAGLTARDGGLVPPDRGGGDGTLKVDSSFKGDALCCFLSWPGACAVFMLEYGDHLFLGFSLCGVLSMDEGKVAPG